MIAENARTGPGRCRRKFLRYFPEGFRDPLYLDWERDYKWQTHLRWEQLLARGEFLRLLEAEDYPEIATRAIRVEQKSRHSMIFSFEKMALRDAVASPAGAKHRMVGHGKFGSWSQSATRSFGPTQPRSWCGRCSF